MQICTDVCIDYKRIIVYRYEYIRRELYVDKGLGLADSQTHSKMLCAMQSSGINTL